MRPGFDGLLSLEIFNDQFRAGSARSVAVDGQRSLIVMLDQLRRDTGIRSRPAIDPAAGSRECRHRVHRIRRWTNASATELRSDPGDAGLPPGPAFTGPRP